MTTLTAPGTTAAPTRRPSASRGLVRTMLLLHRPALYVWAGLFVALGALLLWLYGPGMDAAAEAWRQYDRCTTCSYDQDALLRYKSFSLYATFAVTFLPFLVAAWSGASLVGREVESGTAHLAWTQSVSPARWLAVKLTLPAALITAGTSVLVLLHHQVWARSQGRIHSAKGWSESLTFHANGPTTVAFALCGLVAGALAGLALRRSLAALAIAALATGAVRIVVGMAMPHLWPTVRTVSSLTNNGPEGGSLPSAKASSPPPAPNCPTRTAAAASTRAAASSTTGSTPSASTATRTPDPTTGRCSSWRPAWSSSSPRSRCSPPSGC